MIAAKVKICGLTTVGDAALAASLGADYLGVIFADSPRRVDVTRAQEIRATVPSSALVGVFKDQSLDDVVRAALACDLDLIQLHGIETPSYCDQVLEGTGKPVVKAFRAARVPEAAELATFRTAKYFLFDLDRGAGDESVWDDVATTRGLGFRLFVAGGLDATNVRAVVARTHAFAVDVCRGVEREPGVKDPRALERFMMEVRA